jgi:hypothetical protein
MGKTPSTGPPEARWLLLIHQIPPKPAYLRVKIGRHLQRIGAVPIKNSVYALPRNDETQEDFQWVLREIVKGGGDASILEARFVEGLSDEQVLSLFQSAREADYRDLAEEARQVAASLPKRGPPPENRRNEVANHIARLRQRMSELVEIDFFGAPGREIVEGLVSGMEARMKPSVESRGQARATVQRDAYRGRTWDYVTRANAAEDNVRLYHVVKGRRRQFAGWDGKVAAQTWHTLAVEARGDRFQVFYDGKQVMDAKDETFKDAGKVGVWTKADSVTYFDALSVKPLQ